MAPTGNWKTCRSASREADDKLTYDQGIGVLSYDADGSAAGGPIKIADLDNCAALHFNDLVLV